MRRFRTLKMTESMRKMVRDVKFDINNFIYPLFVTERKNVKEEIISMPGQYRFSHDRLEEELDLIYDLGIRNILVFGIPDKKDSVGSGAYDDGGVVQKAVRLAKKSHAGMTVITDVCMCEYTNHGHCGIIKDGRVDNDATLDYLSRIALSHAESGADMVAPSDMMDGRIGAIRNVLDGKGFSDKGIISYSVKYSSSYYGPFREAAGSTPGFGDRKSYQMDFMRSKEAFDKVETDIAEGADMVMVKPALAYLDMIRGISEAVNVPVAAYNVSGEYAMIKAASINGWLDEKKVVIENMAAILRAGADVIISYHAKDLAKWFKEGIDG
jgi:porphobilinogen synthase